MQLNERSVTRAVAQRLQRWPAAYWMSRAAYQRGQSFRLPLQLPGVPGKIHANDEMLRSTSPVEVTGYVEAGRQATDLVVQAWRATGRPVDKIRSVLDLGSGYGRVTRWLARAMAAPRITACDLNEEALRFLRSQFGVRVLPSAPDWADVEFDTYDLVWMGSLLTHLSAASWDALWKRLGRVLETGGVVVLTTWGPAALERLDDCAPRLGRHRQELASGLEGHGMGFVRFPHYRFDYGIALHDPEFVRAEVAAHLRPARQLFHRPGIWSQQQDVYAFHRGLL
jgi:SAM-dependent methyltransferase